MKKLCMVLGIVLGASMVVPAQASHPSTQCIDVEPDSWIRFARNDEALTVSLGASDAGHPPQDEGCVIDPGSRSGTPVEIDLEIVGDEDPDSSDSPETPDLTCVIGAESFSCSVYPGGGDQTFRVWVDEDANDATVEADLAEEQDEIAFPGDFGEPDNTDVAHWSWTHREPRHVSTHTTIHYSANGPFLHGTTESSLARCAKHRYVDVRKRTPGRDHVLGTTMTDNDGKWTWAKNRFDPGRYYAFAWDTPKQGPNGNFAFCLPDKSRDQRVP
jgi:hypothetical protein